jgi:hypothetical protein
MQYPQPIHRVPDITHATTTTTTTTTNKQTNHPSAAGSYTSFVNHLTTSKNLKQQRGTLSLRVQILHLFSASPHSSRATIAASRSAARRGSAEGKYP